MWSPLPSSPLRSSQTGAKRPESRSHRKKVPKSRTTVCRSIGLLSSQSCVRRLINHQRRRKNFRQCKMDFISRSPTDIPESRLGSEGSESRNPDDAALAHALGDRLEKVRHVNGQHRPFDSGPLCRAHDAISNWRVKLCRVQVGGCEPIVLAAFRVDFFSSQAPRAPNVHSINLQFRRFRPSWEPPAQDLSWPFNRPSFT
jgi:hypothetical protein